MKHYPVGIHQQPMIEILLNYITALDDGLVKDVMNDISGWLTRSNAIWIILELRRIYYRLLSKDIKGARIMIFDFLESIERNDYYWYGFFDQVENDKVHEYRDRQMEFVFSKN